MVNATQAALSQIDILVLNVSVQLPRDWTSITRADFDRQVAVNYRASLELMQLVVPELAARKWDRVLTIGSVQERAPNPEMLIYSSLKSAQTALGLSLAKQYAPDGITFNNLAPGVIETDRYHSRVKSDVHAE